MKILVTTKRVPNPDDPIRLRPDGLSLDESATGHVLNPFDAIALEEALRIREGSVPSCEIVAVSIGPESCDEILRTALAMGADRALRIASAGSPDSWSVAQILAAVVGRERPVLLLMGKQAVDNDSNQAGQMLAGLLDWPQATFASKIEILDGGHTLRVARETDLGLETVLVRLPAVVTTDLRLNEPRYASLPALMKAKKRPIEVVTLDELGVAVEPRIKVVGVRIAAVERTCVRVADAAELVRLLRHEAKVI
jgi:electron transfer flavoprotein beta subunit